MQIDAIAGTPITKSKIKTFFFNGALMTACSIILRTISVSFNVYIANTAGAEAVGLYTLLGGVFGFAITLALSGIHLALTRLVSESMATGDRAQAIKIIKTAAALAIFFGLLSSVLLFFLSDPLSKHWLLDTRAELPLKILAISLPFAALSSVFNGYFTAMRRAYKNAISQLTEMTVKILFTVFLFSEILKRDAETACIILVLGSTFAELCVFFVNLIIYIFDRLRHLRGDSKKERGVVKKILSISLPVALTAYIRSALLSVEHSLIPKGLYKFGGDKSIALSEYGVLSGMALPVINFPYALIGSFTSLLIPEVAESNAKGCKRHLRYITSRTFQFCLIFAFCVCGIFFVFSSNLGKLLYNSNDAGNYIRFLSLLVPIMYIDTSTDSILKGMGEQLYCMKVNIADALLSVIFVSFLVPRYGIIGYIATIYMAEIINTAFSITRLLSITDFKFDIKKLIFAPAFCVIGAGALYYLISHFIFSSNGLLATIIGIAIFVSLYIFLLRLTYTFSSDDVLWLKSVFKK